MSEARHWQAIADLVTGGHDGGKLKGQVADEIVSRVLADFKAGEHYAAETLMRWERMGAARDYAKSHKKHNTTAFITRAGRRIRRTTSYSRPVRSPESSEIVGYQEQLWWTWTRLEVLEHRNEIAGQRNILADVVQAHDAILAAMDRHPACLTARDAWEADGRSIAEINLGEEAA